LAGAGRHADAIATLRQGIERNPQDASLHRGLAWLLATSPNAQDRSGAEALQIARRLVQTFPNDPIAHDTLAAAYAEAGQFLEAIQHATQAIKLADQQGNRELVQEIRKRLAEYENRQPHRQ
jgi:Flp pilus assembly protein TadD